MTFELQPSNLLH